jgi:hypothetical protein
MPPAKTALAGQAFLAFWPGVELQEAAWCGFCVKLASGALNQAENKQGFADAFARLANLFGLAEV